MLVNLDAMDHTKFEEQLYKCEWQLLTNIWFWFELIYSAKGWIFCATVLCCLFSNATNVTQMWAHWSHLRIGRVTLVTMLKNVEDTFVRIRKGKLGQGRNVERESRRHLSPVKNPFT